MTGTADQGQRLVIEAPAERHLVVTAPPGSGKTWTAAERLRHLAGQDSEDDRALLALSFSRAAAFALTSQLHRAGVGARVEVRTIDSWAARLADRAGASGNEGVGYEASIARALEVVTGGTDVDEYRHIVVDEAQDVRGARASLVEHFLRSGDNVGWTVLGDAAQAIYDFDDDGSTNLLSKVQAMPLVQQMELTECHRAQTDHMYRIVRLGEHLRVQPIRSEDRRPVWDEYRNLRGLDLPSLLLAAKHFADDETSTAVLMRDNRRVLELSDHLADRAVPHEITSARADGSVPAWVAMLCPHAGTALSDDDIGHLVPPGIDPLPVVRAVRSVCRTAARSVMTDGIADRMLSGRPPEALLQPTGTALTLSTIHRAKGLEYDKVFVSMHGVTRRNADDEADDDATRVLYVAMTRARSELHRFTHDARLDTVRDQRSHRWTDVRFAGKTRRTVAFEVGPTDINFLAPWHDLLERLDAIERVGTGTRVQFEPGELGPTGLPSFTVIGCDTGAVLGTTTPAVGEFIERLGWSSATLVGARVVGRCAVALPRGVGDRRIAVAPVVRGMVSKLEGDERHV